MVAVREPTLRTTANSRTMAEMMASKDEGITWRWLKNDKVTLKIRYADRFVYVSNHGFTWVYHG